MQGYQTQQSQPQQQQSVKAESQSSVLPGVNPPNPALENTNGEEMEVDQSESPKKRPFWAKGGSKWSKNNLIHIACPSLITPFLLNICFAHFKKMGNNFFPDCPEFDLTQM